jgi:hypothetical protein
LHWYINPEFSWVVFGGLHHPSVFVEGRDRILSMAWMLQLRDHGLVNNTDSVDPA